MSLSKFGTHYAGNVKNNDKFNGATDIDVKNVKIINLKLPENKTDAVNKMFVDDYLSQFYKGVSDSLQSIIDSTNVEYDNLKKSFENLKNQNNLRDKSIKTVDTNFKKLKQQVKKLEKDLKLNVTNIDLVNKTNDNLKNNLSQITQQVTKVEIDFKNTVKNIEKSYKDLVNKSNINIQNDLTKIKKQQDDIFIKKEKELKDTLDKIYKTMFDNVHRMDNLEKLIKRTEKLYDQQQIDTAINTSVFNAKFDDFNTKFVDFKTQLDEIRKALNYYEKQIVSNNSIMFTKFDNHEKRIQLLESKP